MSKHCWSPVIMAGLAILSTFANQCDWISKISLTPWDGAEFGEFGVNQLPGENCTYNGKHCLCLVGEEDEIKEPPLELLYFFKNGAEWLKNYTHETSAVLMLGNTGSGKTTTAYIVAGDMSRLHSVVNGKSFVIMDEDNKIGVPSTKSKTLFPELIKKHENGSTLSFYDLPGFDDTRGAVEDIVANFLINGIVQKIDKLKMFFLAPYSDIIFSSRDNFDKLATHATTLVKDIGKFNSSYGLLITKAPSFDSSNGCPILDSELMNTTLTFLQKYRTELQKNLQSGNEKEKKALKKITFVDNLLLTDDEGGHKIWFVKTPEQCGPLSESKRMMDVRSNITNLYERLNYTSIDENMFGFTIRGDTREKIRCEYVEAVNNAIGNAITLVTKEMFESYKDDILHRRRSYTKLYQKLVDDGNAVGHLMNSSISNPDPAYNALKLFWHKVGFQMSKKLEEFLKQQQLYLEFFDKVSGVTYERNVTEWMRHTTDIKSYIDDHRKWYEFCIALESALYGYIQQSRLIPPPASNDWLKHIIENKITTVSDDIKQISKRIEKQELRRIGEMLTFTLTPPTVTCENTTNKLIIKGNVMALKKMMSKITESLNNCKGVQQIDFYAAHTMFLDDNIIDQNSARNIVVIAPKLDSPISWSLMLSGIDAQKHSPEKAQDGIDGSTTNINGNPGCAGLPGGSAYSAFIVAGHITSTSKLLVNTTGGLGGPGQHGGNGGKGSSIRNATSYGGNCTNMDAPNYCFETGVNINCTHYGFTSQDAGNGGDGGQKGAGGLSGVNTVIQFLGNTMVEQVFGRGPDGEEGVFGIGGEALRGGMGYTCLGNFCMQNDPSDGQRYGRHGINGKTGESSNCLQTPVKRATLLEWLSLVQYQAAFVNDSNQELMQISHDIAFNVKTENYFTLNALGEESHLLLNLNQNIVNNQRLRSLLLSLVQRFQNYFTKHYQGANNEQKKIMTMFLTSSFSAMGRMRMPTALSLIVDGESHLKDIEQNINSLKLSGDRNSLHQLVNLEKDNWREILSQKFLHATEFAIVTVASALVKAGVALKYEAIILGEQLDSVLEHDAMSMEEAIRVITEWEEKMRIHWSLEVYSVVFYFTKDDLPYKNLFDLVVADLYAKYHGQIDKLEMLANLSNRLKNMSTELKQRKQNFETQFVPLIDSLLNHYTNISASLANGGDINPPAMELSKREVLEQLRNCKISLQTFLDEMVVFKPVVDAFNRIQDALTFSMELYEISHDYMEIQSLAKYFGIVQSTSLVNVPITDPDFKHTLAEFDRHVRESRIDEQVVAAVSGFKQWVFPYANYYLQSLNEVDPLVRLLQLQVRIKDYKEGKLGQGDNSLKLAKFDYDSTLTSKPFFTWENQKFSSDIKSLLDGEPVEFHADVTQQGHIGREAIKCKLIEVKFIVNAENNTEKMQLELDHLLENFGVSLTHSGISHFRFQKDHFVMSSDSQTLKYNFEEDGDGNRLGTNDVYESFKKGDIQLSPFTVWTLQLNLTSSKVNLQDGASFDDLQKFAPYVDIHLVGQGTYVDGNEALANGDLELLKHYERDVRRLTDFEFLEKLTFTNSCPITETTL